MTLEIKGEIEKLSLKPEDKVVVTTPYKLSTIQRQEIKQQLTSLFPNNVVIILDSGNKLEVISEGEK